MASERMAPYTAVRGTKPASPEAHAAATSLASRHSTPATSPWPPWSRARAAASKPAEQRTRKISYPNSWRREAAPRRTELRPRRRATEKSTPGTRGRESGRAVPSHPRLRRAACRPKRPRGPPRAARRQSPPAARAPVEQQPVLQEVRVEEAGTVPRPTAGGRAAVSTTPSAPVMWPAHDTSSRLGWVSLKAERLFAVRGR